MMAYFRSFYEEEEKLTFEKMKEMKNDYNIISILGPQYKDCQMGPALSKLKELSQQKTFFEKIHAFREINSMLTKAAREAFYKLNKKECSIDSDFYLTMWTYLLSLSNWTNVICDIIFVYNFSFFMGPMEASGYLTTTLIGSLTKIRTDISKSDSRLSQNIAQSIISTKIITPFKSSD